MKQWKHALVAVMMMAGVIGAAALPAAPAGAINVFEGCNGKSEAVCKASKTDTEASVGGKVRTIVNTMLYILGIIAVIMIVFSGIRYTTSTGDASKVKASKDTLLYAIVGLIVAMLAWTIVNFVIGKF